MLLYKYPNSKVQGGKVQKYFVSVGRHCPRAPADNSLQPSQEQPLNTHTRNEEEEDDHPHQDDQCPEDDDRRQDDHSLQDDHCPEDDTVWKMTIVIKMISVSKMITILQMINDHSLDLVIFLEIWWFTGITMKIVIVIFRLKLKNLLA